MSDQHKDITLEMAVGGNSNITTYNPTDDWDDTKEDPNDNLGRVDSNYFPDPNNPTPTHHNNAPPGSPPTFTRRMSSQLSIQFERQSSVLEQSGMAAYIPNSIASHIPGLARQKTQKTLTATYFCNICFAKYPIDEGFTLRECQHQFCIECMKNFFSNKIEQGIVYLTCFHPGSGSGTAADTSSCSIPIAEADIHQLLDGPTWDKYEKFKSNLDHTLSRQCPYCDATAIGTKDNHIISCAQCAKQYCLYHSNAHDIAEETCESYELRTAKETRMNEMALQQLGDGCQPCPQCEFRIIKSGGCNHMKCVKCGCSFCWLCSEVIEDTELPNHYKSEDSKCKGQQFAGMEEEQPPLSIVVVLILCMCVFCVPGLALGIVFGCLCHPIVSFCCVNDQNVLETVMMCSMVWMMIPAVIILSILIVIWSGLKSTYDNIRSVCNCLPACPDSWIDTVHAQQAQQAQVAQ